MYNIEMRHCTIYEMKTKALVTAKLICVFVFAYAIAGYSFEVAHVLCLLY